MFAMLDRAGRASSQGEPLRFDLGRALGELGVKEPHRGAGLGHASLAEELEVRRWQPR